MILQQKTYKFRIYPTNTQEKILNKMFGCSRFVWNFFLNKEKEHYLKNQEQTEENRGKNYLSFFDNAKVLTEIKKQEETKFLQEANSQSLQSTLKHLDVAYKRFFIKKSGYPKFKKKNGKQSFSIPQNLSIENGKLYIPKLKDGIKIVEHQKLKGRITTSTLSKSKTNKYYISIGVEEDIQQLPKSNKSIGIDLGIKSFCFISDGKEIENPRFFKKQEKKLKLAQKLLNRKKKGSNRRIKQKLKVARLHKKVTQQKQDFLQKLSTKLIHENQVICLEKLNVKGMLQNHKLSKSIQNCSWSSFVDMLKYKAKWFGREIVFVDRFFPSSKTCFECGCINHNLKLEDREWTCLSCGIVHQRDLNAAKNILKEGLKLFYKSSGTDDNRHGESVRPGEKSGYFQ